MKKLVQLAANFSLVGVSGDQYAIAVLYSAASRYLTLLQRPVALHTKHSVAWVINS
jgi:hypothetical protein